MRHGGNSANGGEHLYLLEAEPFEPTGGIAVVLALPSIVPHGCGRRRSLRSCFQESLFATREQCRTGPAMHDAVGFRFLPIAPAFAPLPAQIQKTHRSHTGTNRESNVFLCLTLLSSSLGLTHTFAKEMTTAAEARICCPLCLRLYCSSGLHAHAKEMTWKQRKCRPLCLRLLLSSPPLGLTNTHAKELTTYLRRQERPPRFHISRVKSAASAGKLCVRTNRESNVFLCLTLLSSPGLYICEGTDYLLAWARKAPLAFTFLE